MSVKTLRTFIGRDNVFFSENYVVHTKSDFCTLTLIFFSYIQNHVLKGRQIALSNNETEKPNKTNGA